MWRSNASRAIDSLASAPKMAGNDWTPLQSKPMIAHHGQRFWAPVLSAGRAPALDSEEAHAVRS